MADTVDGPTGQRAVVEVGHRRVPEHAGRAVGYVPFRSDVDRLARVVELPTESLGRRVGVHLAQYVHALAPRRADHQHPVGLAARSVCGRKKKKKTKLQLTLTIILTEPVIIIDLTNTDRTCRAFYHATLVES